jgi:hypothetical protein
VQTLRAPRRRDGSETACIAGLLLVILAPYGPSFDDYFRGDDFDLVQSFYGKLAG